ncbi:BSD domain protein [Scedosporium apiospermum]|uniref:BSD domain protein n=1 Tax=Pseudallescheria apiosperma TaxID=563466 RepID=A0A084FWM3_PSEDA|nr:BSD domain protein [Scedosporium apiospermum]KEZ39485.1 BSD domain protein [Scedosporium apiospermum]
MDIAYDHIQESSFPKVEEEDKKDSKQEPPPQPTLNEDIQEAYKAISSSTWGSRIGGFIGSVVKQGEQVYSHAQQELSAVGGEATRGFSDLREAVISRTRSLSLTTAVPAQSSSTDQTTRDANQGEDRAATPTNNGAGDTMLGRFKSEAAKRLHDLQRAEDAADEALLKFGTNMRDFLKSAITIAPPAEGEGQGSTVMFESKDAQGKRVIHTSRFDAQLHVIHTSVDSFTKDPESEEFTTWAKDFDVEKKTADISSDLSKYPELRSTMEKLVPDQIPYADFWKRYYFVRHSIETAEARRRDLLKAASAEDEVGWGDDSDDETDDNNTQKDKRPGSTESSTTIHPPAPVPAAVSSLKPRKSNDEKSQPDSEASYDVVGAQSGVPSQAPNSPKDSKKDDDSDDDWE